MNKILKLIFLILFFNIAIAREVGETEITTEDGIEVYQNEKYYLLKKNVKINSDNFNLNADIVKIIFNDNMYDIVELNAKENVVFESSAYNTKGSGENLNFKVNLEEILIEGINSKLLTEDITMLSDSLIKVNNLTGEFSLNGPNSKLFNQSIFIEAESINGIFSNQEGMKKITFLNVIDDKLSYVKNNNSEMYAKKINFNNDTSIIELIDDVTIIRDGEKISGDYGTLDTKNDSYKIKSNNKSKVKVIIQNDE